MKPAEIYHAVKLGEHILYDDLKPAHAYFLNLGRMLQETGPTFQLAAEEAFRIAGDLQLFLVARKFDDACEDRNTDSYRDGYRTGIVWNQKKDNYRPGGPHYYTVREGENKDAKWVKICEEGQRHHRRWMMGFDEGLAAQQAGAKATPEMLCCGMQEGPGHRHWLTCLVDRAPKAT